MKTKFLFYVLLLIVGLASCQGRGGSRTETGSYPEPAIDVAIENLVTISFDVEGMTCTGCETSVKTSLERMEGVIEAQASHQEGKATVQYDKSRVTAEDMEATIESRGYSVTGHSPGE